MKKIVFLGLILICLSCTNDKIHPYTFYYWKTNLNLNHIEKDVLHKTDFPALYTRFFDVDKIEGEFQPIAVFTKDKSFITNKNICPVVFITNRSFLNIQKNEIGSLANQIFELIEKKEKDSGFRKSNEIQIDCDWTAGTKDDYFEFLEVLKQVSKRIITSTLRLHQVNNTKIMGVPPVSKVYLMCYSTSSPLENSDKNSILDVDILKKYLKNLKNYPIKNIDIALPIYSWGIVTNHVGKHKLINGLTDDDLDLPNLKKISETSAVVEKDGFYFGFFLNKGFIIKIEEISNSQLDEVVKFLDSQIKDYTIVYYQLNAKFVEHKNLTR